MKKYFSLLFILTIVSVSTVFAQFGNQPQTPNDTLTSTKVLKSGDVEFKIYAPEAKDVTLGGDIIPWGQDIKSVKDENGVWTITIPNVKAGTYRYNFVVDGVKVFDPKAANAFETSALIDVMPNGDDEFFALRKDVPHGASSEIYYYSSTTNSMRRMHVWTPAGYNLGDEKLPVLYLIHGGGDSDVAWPNVGRAGFIMDNLLSEGECEKMIVVMPHGGIDTQVFVEDLQNDIIPFIESNYNVYTDNEHRALAGLSMGGLETLESFMTYPDMYSYINVMSSGWFENDEAMYEAGDKKLAEVAPILKKTVKYLIFTQGGPEDIAYNNCKSMLKVFDKHDIKYDFSEMPGGHSWLVWRNDLKNFAQNIFK